MRIEVRSGQVRGGVQAFGALEGEQRLERLVPRAAAGDRALNRLIVSAGFRGTLNETLLLPRDGQWTLVVGLGKAKELSLDGLRQFAGTAARTVRAHGFTRLVLPVIHERAMGSPAIVAQALTEGRADAALAASLFHFGELSIGDVKTYLARHEVCVRP